MVYLASPYAHKDPFVRGIRWRCAALVYAQLVERGEIIYSPIAIGHPTDMIYPLPDRLWLGLGLRMVGLCTSIWILALPGWDKSSGIKEEREIAASLKIPEEFLNPEDFELRAGLKQLRIADEEDRRTTKI